MDADRNAWTERALDERFAHLERRLDPLDGIPANVASIKEILRAQADDIRDAKTASQATMRVLLGFFSALLIVLLSAIVGVVIVL